MYFHNLIDLIEKSSISVKDSKYNNVNSLYDLPLYLNKKIKRFKYYNKLIFIGNGGSAAIANHLANDFNKNAGIKSISFSDSSSLTCLANDYGYENVFLKSLEFHALSGDILFAISSSGKSQNILRAVKYALKNNITTITFSGFKNTNPLRKLGHLNVYIPNGKYGYVELSHFNICHYIIDYFCN